MKVTHLLKLSAFLILLSSNCLAQQDYIVKGKIKNWPGEYINLETNGNIITKDSVKNIDGSFEFKGKIDGFTNAFIVQKYGEEPSYKFFFLGPDTVQIDGDYNNLSSAKISGSKYSTQYEQIKELHEISKNKIDSLYNLVNQESNKDISKGYFNEIENLEENDIQNSEDFIKTNPKNLGAIYELSSISLKIEYAKLRALFDDLDSKVKDSKQAKELKTLVMNLENLQIGKIAPNFTQPDSSNRNVQLTDFKGKYVLVDFWASWCIPCRREHPNLKVFYDKYKSKGFEILGVSIDTKEEEWRWKRAILNDGVHWTQVSDLKGPEGDIAKLYAIQMVPNNYLLDPTGKIIAKNLFGEELDKKLNEVLGK